MSLRDIRPEEDVAKFTADVARTERGLRRSSNWRHRRKDGSIFDVEIASNDLPKTIATGGWCWHLTSPTASGLKLACWQVRGRLRLALEAAAALSRLSGTYRTTTLFVTLARNQHCQATEEKRRIVERSSQSGSSDDLAAFDAQLSACMTSGTEYRNAYRVVRADGVSVNLEEYGLSTAMRMEHLCV